MPKRVKSPRARALRLSEMRWNCPANWIPPVAKKGRRKPTDPMLAAGMLGQDRALQALGMGLAMNGPGFHVFVAGLGGSDETERVVELIERLRVQCPLPHDHVYVHNFADSLRPKHIELPAGLATELQAAMVRWVRTLSREIPQLLASERHIERRHKMYGRYRRAEEQLFRRFGRRLQNDGLELVQIEDESGSRRDIYCRIGKQLVPLTALTELPRPARPSVAKQRKLALALENGRKGLRQVQRKARALGLRLLREVQSLDEAVVQEIVESLTLALAEEIGADLELAGWLGDCAQYANTWPQLFLRKTPGEEGDEEEHGNAPHGVEVFGVNIVRSNPDEPACPIVYEQHPNYSNLFGTVERHLLNRGTGYVHMAVRPGALMAADGGFLVLNARDIFREAEVWRALKRTLQTGRLEVHALEAMSPLGVTGARPQAVPIDIKIVLVGSAGLYEHLLDQDVEFSDIFKIKAEFEDNEALHKKSVGRLAQALRVEAKAQNLLPLSRDGLQALIERAVQMAGRQTRLSSELSVLTDYAREASYFAQRAQARSVRRAHVDQARIAFRYMHAVDAEWHLRHVLEGVYQLETRGKLIGSINALTVVGMGPLSFGRVARISAVVSAGDESYLNIERDVDLSGPIHNKGVLMLESFMRHRFGQKRSLPIKVSLAFDQSYGPIDGDSASSTEIYALLSAIADLPLRQDIAVTGAVNMKGEVLAVGGIGAKIRGFYELCKASGLSGTQGVIMPEANVGDLMLDHEILAAVKAKKFHLWSVNHVDAGIALLTGETSAAVRRKVTEAMDTFEKALKHDDDAHSGGSEKK
jgi:predicted ATP-dependent protease